MGVQTVVALKAPQVILMCNEGWESLIEIICRAMKITAAYKMHCIFSIIMALEPLVFACLLAISLPNSFLYTCDMDAHEWHWTLPSPLPHHPSKPEMGPNLSRLWCLVHLLVFHYFGGLLKISQWKYYYDNKTKKAGSHFKSYNLVLLTHRQKSISEIIYGYKGTWQLL